jgi:hypothetical protein
MLHLICSSWFCKLHCMYGQYPVSETSPALRRAVVKEAPA